MRVNQSEMEQRKTNKKDKMSEREEKEQDQF